MRLSGNDLSFFDKIFAMSSAPIARKGVRSILGTTTWRFGGRSASLFSCSAGVPTGVGSKNSHKQ